MVRISANIQGVGEKGEMMARKKQTGWNRYRLKNGRFAKKRAGRRRETARPPKTTTIRRYYKIGKKR